MLSILLGQDLTAAVAGQSGPGERNHRDPSPLTGPGNGCLPTTPREREPAGLNGVVLGVLAGLNEAGEPLVGLATSPAGRPLPGRSLVAIQSTDVGREVVLVFPEGSPQAPIVLGFLQARRVPGSEPRAIRTKAKRRPVRVEADGERLVFTAETELVFRCGEASITLTRAGKVLIRGKYLLSRSTGVNRIKGGSVQVN